MVKFLKSSSNITNYYQHNNKEVCFVGRSNVGKSSLINALVNQKIARVSKLPGRTRLINFFEYQKQILVDLPGYGFAKMSMSQKKEVFLMTNQYLQERKNLACVFLLIDLKVGMSQNDYLMLNYLQEFNCDFVIIGTKRDKCKQSQLNKSLQQIQQFNAEYLLTSSFNKTDIDKLRKIIKFKIM